MEEERVEGGTNREPGIWAVFRAAEEGRLSFVGQSVMLEREKSETKLRKRGNSSQDSDDWVATSDSLTKLPMSSSDSRVKLIRQSAIPRDNRRVRTKKLRETEAPISTSSKCSLDFHSRQLKSSRLSTSTLYWASASFTAVEATMLSALSSSDCPCDSVSSVKSRWCPLVLPEHCLSRCCSSVEDAAAESRTRRRGNARRGRNIGFCKAEFSRYKVNRGIVEGQTSWWV